VELKYAKRVHTEYSRRIGRHIEHVRACRLCSRSAGRNCERYVCLSPFAFAPRLTELRSFAAKIVQTVEAIREILERIGQCLVHRQRHVQAHPYEAL
jgi:hypothetical protein